MPDAGDEITDHQGPMADFVEPVMDAADMFILDVQHPPKARMQELPPDGPTDDVTARDAANAAGKGSSQRWDEAQMALVDQESAAREQELVRYRQTNNAEHQRREDSDVAISRYPL